MQDSLLLPWDDEFVSQYSHLTRRSVLKLIKYIVMLCKTSHRTKTGVTNFTPDK